MTLLAFLVACAALFGTFRGLSSPRAGLAPALRVSLGGLLVYFIALWFLWLDCGPWGLLLLAVVVAVGSTGLQGDELARIGRAMGGSRFVLLLLSVATVGVLVYLFVPIVTFLTSPGELDIHLDYLLSVNLRDVMVAVYTTAALYALLPSSRMKSALTVFALSALLLALIYATALPFGYPMMSGLMFEQVPIRPSSRALRLLVDLTLIATVSIALRWSLRKFPARYFIVGIVLANLSLLAAAGVNASRERIGEAGGTAAQEASTRTPLRFSPDHPNVLIIFLDRFMGSYVEAILGDEPGLEERLNGFTWFPRTVAAGENSIAGVHPMLGGYDYTPVAMNARKERLVDLSTEAFSILPYNFSRRGYQVNVVNPGGLGFTMEGDCTYLAMDGVTCTHIPPSVVKSRAEEMKFPLSKISESSYADLLVLLASMRSTPYLMKEVVHTRGPWRPFLDHSAGTTFRIWAQLKAFPDLSIASAREPNLNIVSNLLPHEPYFLSDDCLPQQERNSPSLQEVHKRGFRSVFAYQHSVAARCTLLLTADYLDYLKSSGVYDNTKIVIVSDHGIVGDVDDLSQRAVAGGTSENIYVRSRSVLLVKDVGATGPLQISEEFLPNAEVPRIVCEEIGGCVNPYIDNRPIESLGRNDPFFVSMVPWQFSLQEPDAFVIRAQLVLTGKDPFDAKGWAIER